MNALLKAYHIKGSSSYANPTDTTTLKAHLQQHLSSFGKAPKKLTADAGYGSEENYQLLEEQKVEAFVKYGMFDKQQNGKYNSKSPYAADKLFYNQQEDCYICPIGQQMYFIGSYIKTATTDFEQTLKRYHAEDCKNCPMRENCHKSKENRIIEVNENLNRRKKRCHDVEPVFGNIKQNHGFRRFMLRGKEKVDIERGLLAIAQNIRK